MVVNLALPPFRLEPRNPACTLPKVWHHFHRVVKNCDVQILFFHSLTYEGSLEIPLSLWNAIH